MQPFARLLGTLRLGCAFRRASRSLPGLRFRLRTWRRRAHCREQHIQPRSLAQRENLLDSLIHRIALHQPVAINAMHLSAARVQQPQVVVDLRRRRHRRPRIARRVLLLDGDGRRHPVDLIHVRLLNALQKLPRIRRKRLHIPPLSLGINRVEGQRTLARARHAADHRQLAMRYLAGEIFQVVRPRIADDDGIVQREGTEQQDFRQRHSALREPKGATIHP